MFGCFATAVYLLFSVRSRSTLAEDAAILTRYARHVARGLGYVWNPGDLPVDGATDWLGTTILAGLYALGTPLELGPRLLSGAAHALTVALVIVVMHRGFGAPLVLTLISAALVMLGPAHAYVEAGFLAPLFALPVLLGWACIVFAASDGRRLWASGFALAMLAATLERPEGLALTALMLVAAWLVLDSRTLRRCALATLSMYLPLLVLFALWRWQYFGHLLPLPFLKKGGGALHWDGLVDSLKGGLTLLWWVALAPVLGLRGGRSLRWSAALAIVCGGFLAIWVLLSHEMNYFWRFQYAVVPITASSWWGAAGATWEEVAAAIGRLPRPSRRAWVAAAVLLVVGALTWQHRRFMATLSQDGLMTTGVMMRGLGGPDRRLVTTEAGLLPLYSEWHTVDAWGLNDMRIVSERGITDQYLSAIDADVIMFHAYYTPLTIPGQPANEWDAMVAVLHRFASCHGYKLAAAFAPELTQSHYYFVKAGWSGAEAFTSAIRQTPYAWSGSGAQPLELSALDRYHPACGA